jgi:hypothetical protein
MSMTGGVNHVGRDEPKPVLRSVICVGGQPRSDVGHLGRPIVNGPGGQEDAIDM